MIGIIGAMPEEIAEIKSNIINLKTIEHNTRTFYTGTIYNKEVVLVLAGIGKTNAAITTTLLLELFDIDLVVNIGVAGGQNGAKHNDIIVSSSVVYFDVNVTRFAKYSYGQIPGQNPEFRADHSLVQLSNEILSTLDLPHKIGRIASGDQFVYSKQTVAEINALYNDIYAVEMEAAAIAHTATVFNIPFIIYRSISDVLEDPTQAEDFDVFLETASKNAATLLLALLKHLS